MSIHLFKLQHQKHMYIHKKQLQPDQSQRPGQKFVLGLQRDIMQANAIQHGHHQVAYHIWYESHEIVFYIAHVMDDWGNSVPIFVVLYFCA